MRKIQKTMGANSGLRPIAFTRSDFAFFLRYGNQGLQVLHIDVFTPYDNRTALFKFLDMAVDHGTSGTDQISDFIARRVI